MTKIKRGKLKRNTRNRIHNTLIAVISLIVIIVAATAVGQYVAQAVDVNLGLTDHTIASIYVFALLMLYLLASFMLPKARR